PSRRLRLLTHMRETDSLIIEDDYDSEFRYRGKPTPALKALPHSEHVIYLGSFSKFLAPGLRLGYIVAEPELIERMRTHRRYSIRHVPGHTQRAMALLIDSGQFHRTISRRRNHPRRKWETLTAALAKHLPRSAHSASSSLPGCDSAIPSPNPNSSNACAPTGATPSATCPATRSAPWPCSSTPDSSIARSHGAATICAGSGRR